jgi:hypothetical protein
MYLEKIIPYTTSPYITLALVVIVLLLLFISLHLYRKLHIFMRGEDGKTLESTIRTYLNHVDDLKKHDELISKYALDLETRLAQCVRNVTVARFKAFDTNGSNQSFSIALVNEHGDGVVISSLHHRDRAQMFAKPVKQYESEYDLTEEEQEVINQAKNSHK